MSLGRASLLVAIPLLIYLPFLGGGWITDDFRHVGHLERQTLGSALVSPDVFGYFRPIPQASLRANLALGGRTPWTLRLTNLLVHVAVILTAFLLARALLGDGEAAFLATLAFVLTPKAHPLAVQWVSARPEILMTLFSMLAALAWINWDRGRGRAWLVVAFLACLLAISSKEAAALLPLLLLAAPSERPLRAPRVAAAAAMIAVAGLMLLIRLRAGARSPWGDAYYDLLAPIGRDLHNARNYFGRAAPASLALVVVAALVATRAAWTSVNLRDLWRRTAGIAVFSIAWFALWIAPVLPLPARSELYIYGAGFGLCLLAGVIAEGLWPPRWTLRAKTAIAILILAFGGYQAARAAGGREVARFSATLAAALATDEGIRAHTGVVILIPEDKATEDLLESVVGGYLTSALRLVLERDNIDGVISFADRPATVDGYRVACRFRDGRLVFRRV